MNVQNLILHCRYSKSRGFGKTDIWLSKFSSEGDNTRKAGLTTDDELHAVHHVKSSLWQILCSTVPHLLHPNRMLPSCGKTAQFIWMILFVIWPYCLATITLQLVHEHLIYQKVSMFLITKNQDTCPDNEILNWCLRFTRNKAFMYG